MLRRAVGANPRARGGVCPRCLCLAVHCACAGKSFDRARYSGESSLTTRCLLISAPVPSAWRWNCSAPCPVVVFRTAPASGSTRLASERHWIIDAARSEQQGVRLTGLTVFRFDTDFQFKERIEAREATLEAGRWLFKIGAPIHPRRAPGRPGQLLDLPTTLTPAQVRNSFSTPETVSFWQLPELYPVLGKFRIRDRRLPLAVPQAASHSRFCWLPWSCWPPP